MPVVDVMAGTPLGRRRGSLGAEVLAAFALLTGVGCVSHEPVPLVPADELAQLAARTPAAAWAGAADAAFPVDDTQGLDEWQLVAVALALHPGLAAARAEIGEAQAWADAAEVLPNPALEAFLRPGLGATSGTAWGLDLLLPFLRPGERSARRAVAELGVELVRAAIGAEELALAADVRRARVAVLAAREAAELLAQELALREEAVELLRRQRALGDVSGAAVALAELDLPAVAAQLRSAQARSRREAAELLELLGLPPELELDLDPDLDQGRAPNGDLALAPDASVIPADQALPDDAALDALLAGPHAALAVPRLAYEQAEAELALAIAGQGPSLGLGPSFERDADGSEGLGLGASMELPLSDRAQGPIAAAMARRDRRRLDHLAALHAIRAAAFAARDELSRRRDEVLHLERDLLPVLERTELLFAAALAARDLPLAEWLALRSRVLQARSGLLEARTQQALALIDLDEATGTSPRAAATVRPDAGSPPPRIPELIPSH